MPGVVRTRAGFAKWTEAVEVVYDTALCTFQSLLAVFWQHDMTGICVFTPEQRRLAEEERSRHGDATAMTISGWCIFIGARRGSQKALLQFEPDVFAALNLKSRNDIIQSWPAARLNGFVCGYGNRDQFDTEWPQFGINDDAIRRKVRDMCGRRV